jgi:beta-lactamase regulating signal transducer with metallopeptidase domain
MTFLLSVTIKVAVLLLGAFAATTLLRHHSAAVRHWILATTLFCALCVPVAELLLPAWTLPMPAAWSTSSASSSLRFVSGESATSATAGSAIDAAPGALTGTRSLASIVTVVWVAGSVFGVAILITGFLRLHALVADATLVSSGPWRDAADAISRRYGLRRPVRILSCEHPTMLATWGVVHPTILLPLGAEGWAEDRIHAVLHHELAHVLRGDWLVAVTGNVLKAVYWFNPLLWIACRRLRHEGERACDDLVLTSGISGAEYATHLLAVARESAQRRHPWSPAIAIAHHSMLEGRVRAMLNVRVNRQPPTGLARATTVAMLVAVTASIGAVSLSGNTDMPTGVSTEERNAYVRDTQESLRVLAEETGGIVPPPLPPAASPAANPAATPATAPAAQTPAAGSTIEGVLYDPFGGLLPGASVRLTQMSTGGSQVGVTDRAGAFAFKGLAAGDYELVTELPGFTTVKNVLRAEPVAPVRRHITLPLGTVQETIAVTCGSADRASRPGAPSASTAPGPTQAAAGQRGAEPKIPSTFTGGIGGQIKAPRKFVHVNPICPSTAVPEPGVVELAGRIGIDGLFTDLHDVSDNAQPPYVASALEAARQWVFSPTLLNNAPIETNISVRVYYSWSN